jgi:hypothetical protein
LQRWTAVLFAVLMAGALGFVVLQVGRQSPAAGADAGADAPVAPVTATLDGGAEPELEDGGAGGGEPLGAQIGARLDAGLTLLSGETAPALGTEAPKSVVFGVVLVQYKGAQGAPATSRSRDAALELAKTLAEEAKTDFKAAVAKGDKGSMENAGRLPRGVLEPAPEFILFSLPKGGTSEPVDTPRGFWIAHRIE